MPTKASMKSEVGELLAEQAELRRLGLELGPRERQRLRSLLIRLGWIGGPSAVNLRRLPKKVLRYAEVGGRYDTHNQLIAAIRQSPEEATPRLALADFMEEHGIPGAKIVRAHAQAMQEGKRTNEANPRHVQPDRQGQERFDSSPLYSFAEGGRHDLGPGTQWEDLPQEHGLSTRLQLYHYGPASHKRGLVLGVNHLPSEDRRSGVVHSVHVATPQKLREMLSDFPPDQVQDILRRYLPRTRAPAKVVDQAAATRSTRLQRRYAKADRNRAPAHPLIAGFPISAALRHLANDPDNSPDLRQTAYVALTGKKGDHISPEGHPEALWALNDLLQEHQNKDGTTGHPLKDVYNWLSAADKIVLDSHTKRALEEAAEDTRRRTPGNHHVGNDPRYGYQWRFTPEHHATMAAAALSAGTPGAWATQGDDGQADDAVLSRVRARVKQLAPHASDEHIDESIRRHHYRAKYLWNKEHGIPTAGRDADALFPVEKRNGEHNKDEVATRYRRKKPHREAIKYGAETTEEDFHKILDANPDDHHTRLVFADWLQERGDPRAEGYRALGMLRKRTFLDTDDNSHWWTHQTNRNPARVVRGSGTDEGWPIGDRHGLPNEWFHAVAGSDPRYGPQWVWHQTRRDADDAAALAFSKLAPEVQARITQQPNQMRRKYAKPRTDFIDALRRARSSQMQALRKAAEQVAAKIGFNPVKTYSALHDGPAGAVAGITQAVYGHASPESLHEAAAWAGLTTGSPGTAVFHPRPTGPDLLHRVRVSGSGFELRQRLDRAGIASRVLIPHRTGYDLLVPDQGGAMYDRISRFAKANHSEHQVSTGYLKLIGNADHAKARSKYRDTVAGAERMARKPRRYAMDLTSTIQQNKLASRLQTDPELPIRQIQDASAGGVLADALDESGLPHAPFYRNLVHRYHPPMHLSERIHNPLGRRDVPASYQTSKGKYERVGNTGRAGAGFEFFPVVHTETGERAMSVTHRPDPSIPPRDRRRRNIPTASSPHHIAVMDAAALREWASHPDVPEDLRGYITASANELEPPTQLRRKRRAMPCPS